MDVVCLGILIADVFPSPIDRMPAAGDLTVVDGYLLGAGGCASNTAACLRRLGHRVQILGKVGSDLFGDFVIQDLNRLGIETTGVRRSSTHPTSNTYIINVKGEDRRYLHCIGANADFSLADVDLASLDGANALYVGGYMVMPNFGPADLAELFKQAKRRGLVTILDVVIGAGKPASIDAVAPAMPFTDVFLPNNDEAFRLTGRTDPVEQATALSDLNSECTVAITLGSRGCVAHRQGVTLQAAAYQVQAVDESGAGDAFTAGFATGQVKGWPLAQTLRFASAVGASCTRALGCTAGVFNFEEAQKFVADNPLEIIQVA